MIPGGELRKWHPELEDFIRPLRLVFYLSLGHQEATGPNNTIGLSLTSARVHLKPPSASFGDLIIGKHSCAILTISGQV